MFSAIFEQQSPRSFVSAWNSNRVQKRGANAKQYPQMKSAGTKHLQRNVISCLSVTFPQFPLPPFFFFLTVQPCAVARGLRPVGRAGMKSCWRNPPSPAVDLQDLHRTVFYCAGPPTNPLFPRGRLPHFVHSVCCRCLLPSSGGRAHNNLLKEDLVLGELFADVSIMKGSIAIFTCFGRI